MNYREIKSAGDDACVLTFFRVAENIPKIYLSFNLTSKEKT